MIVPLRRIDKAMVLALAQLLAEAQAGELECLAYVAGSRRSGHSADVFGPIEGKCATAAQDLLELIQQSK